MVAGDENVAVRRVRRQDNKRSVADRELLVELHLRAQFVRGLEDTPVGEPHLHELGAELDEPVQLQSGIVGLDDLCADCPRPVVRKPPRPRHEQKRRAAKRKDDDGDGFLHS